MLQRCFKVVGRDRVVSGDANDWGSPINVVLAATLNRDFVVSGYSNNWGSWINVVLAATLNGDFVVSGYSNNWGSLINVILASTLNMDCVPHSISYLQLQLISYKRFNGDYLIIPSVHR